MLKGGCNSLFSSCVLNIMLFYLGKCIQIGSKWIGLSTWNEKFRHHCRVIVIRTWSTLTVPRQVRGSVKYKQAWKCDKIELLLVFHIFVVKIFTFFCEYEFANLTLNSFWSSTFYITRWIFRTHDHFFQKIRIEWPLAIKKTTCMLYIILELHSPCGVFDGVYMN